MKHFTKSGNSHLFVFDKGEKIVSTLSAALKEKNLSSGMLTGLGALCEVELGFYHLPKREYDRKLFHDDYELVSCTGNVSLKDGAPFIHAHVALGDTEFRLWGGHLFEARCAVTVELALVTSDFRPERVWNDAVGLATLQQCHL